MKAAKPGPKPGLKSRGAAVSAFGPKPAKKPTTKPKRTR
jgi:hypothetical protein